MLYQYLNSHIVHVKILFLLLIVIMYPFINVKFINMKIYLCHRMIKLFNIVSYIYIEFIFYLVLYMYSNEDLIKLSNKLKIKLNKIITRENWKNIPDLINKD
jgi:hypothetical protein